MDIPIDLLINKVGSLYKLVVLASRRAIELGEGAAKLVDVAKDVRPFSVALKEILEGKITYKEVEKGKE